MSDSHPMLTRPEFNPIPTQDREQLKLLGVFYYVLSGLLAVGGCCSSIYIAIGAAVVSAPPPMDPNVQNGPPPAALGWLFAGIGSCTLLMLLGLAGLSAYTGYCLQHVRKRTFCIVMAAITCIWAPLGTILGVFTLVVLMRPSAAKLFEQVAAERTSQQPPT